MIDREEFSQLSGLSISQTITRFIWLKGKTIPGKIPGYEHQNSVYKVIRRLVTNQVLVEDGDFLMLSGATSKTIDNEYYLWSTAQSARKEKEARLTETNARIAWFVNFVQEDPDQYAAILQDAESTYVTLSYDKISEQNISIAELLHEEPEDGLDIAREAIKQIVNEPDAESKNKTVCLSGDSIPALSLNDVTSRSLGKLWRFEGICREQQPVQTRVVSSEHECPACGKKLKLQQKTLEYKEPTKCTSCGFKGKWREGPKQTSDYSVMVVEQQSARPGKKTVTLPVILEGHLATTLDHLNKHVTVIAIVDSVPVTRNQKQLTVGDFVLRANNLWLAENGMQKSNFSDQEIETIRQVAREWKEDPDSVQDDVFCNLIGNYSLKKVCFLVAASPKNYDERGRRNWLNSIIVSEPGEGKTQGLAAGIRTLVPCKIVGGKGISIAGLRGPTYQSKLTNLYMKEAGAFDHASGGVLVFDEMQQAPEDVVEELRSSSETGEYTVTNASGEHTRVSPYGLLSFGNPKPNDKWDTYLKPYQQLPVKPAMLSRYDLPFCWKPKKDIKQQEEILRLQAGRASRPITGQKRLNEIALWVCYCQQQKDPIVSDEALSAIVYLLKTNESLDPRHQASLIRVSKVLARLELSPVVSIGHMKEAIDCWIEAINTLTDGEKFNFKANELEETVARKEAYDSVLRTVVYPTIANNPSLDSVKQILHSVKDHNTAELWEHFLSRKGTWWDESPKGHVTAITITR